MRVDPPSQCWASHINTFLVQTLIAKIFSTKATTSTLDLSKIVLLGKNLSSSQSSSDNVAKPSMSKLEIPFRAHYRTKWRHLVFDRPFGRARADRMPICSFVVFFPLCGGYVSFMCPQQHGIAVLPRRPYGEVDPVTCVSRNVYFIKAFSLRN